MSRLSRLVATLALAVSLLPGCTDDARSESPGSGGQAGVAGSAGSGGSLGGASGSGGAAGNPAGGSSGDAGPDSGAGGDYALFQKILGGEISANDGLIAIAKSEGLPIQVDAGFLFVRLDDGAGPYQLAGDPTSWQGVAMKQQAGLFWIISAVSAPDGAKYKFVDAKGAFAADPLARRYGYDTYGEYSLVRATPPHLERWPAIGTAGIAPRTLRVWVPAGTATHHLYVHDGQNLFDPEAPYGGWKLQESLGAKTLAVGIDNAGALRMDEYIHVPDVIGGQATGGKGDAYADYVKDVVRPLIEARYGKPTRAGVMGSSLGGLISFHEVLRHPGAWDFAASLSGTFGWGSIGASNETLIERWQKAGKQSAKLYLDSGGGPGSGCVDGDGDGIQDDSPDAADNYCETVQLRDTLSGAGYAFDVDLWHWFESGAEHNEAAWAARVFRPIGDFESL